MQEQGQIFDIDDDLPCLVSAHTDPRLQFQPSSTTHGEYQLVPALHYRPRGPRLNNTNCFEATTEIHFSEPQLHGMTSGFSMPILERRAEMMIMRPNDALIHERLRITFAVSDGRLFRDVFI
jgi:hypothetical protein